MEVRARLTQVSGLLIGDAWVALALLVVTGEAACRDPNPPEVQALVGMKIAPQIKARLFYANNEKKAQYREIQAQGDIPGFVDLGGTLLSTSKASFSLGLSEGFVNGTPVFLIDKIDANSRREIVDAQVLPNEMIEWNLVDGKTAYLPNRYRLSSNCEFKGRLKRAEQFTRLIGLVKPEKGKRHCAHDSDSVVKAWGIDKGSGLITSLPTNSIRCHYIAMDDCK